MEKTLVIFKPDCMRSNLVGAVMERFNKAHLHVIGCKMVQLDKILLRKHYAHHADKPYFPEIEAFMGSHPVIVMVLKGQDAIQRVRDLLGPTDSKAAPKGTLRGDFGADRMNNVCHASDSPESAAEEIERFFSQDEIFE